MRDTWQMRGGRPQYREQKAEKGDQSGAQEGAGFNLWHDKKLAFATIP